MNQDQYERARSVLEANELPLATGRYGTFNERYELATVCPVTALALPLLGRNVLDQAAHFFQCSRIEGAVQEEYGVPSWEYLDHYDATVAWTNARTNIWENDQNDLRRIALALLQYYYQHQTFTQWAEARDMTLTRLVVR